MRQNFETIIKGRPVKILHNSTHVYVSILNDENIGYEEWAFTSDLQPTQFRKENNDLGSVTFRRDGGKMFASVSLDGQYSGPEREMKQNDRWLTGFFTALDILENAVSEIPELAAFKGKISDGYRALAVSQNAATR